MIDFQLLAGAEACISWYKSQHQNIIPVLTDRQIEAFSLRVFDELGWPHSIKKSTELWRYHDVMHEDRASYYLAFLGNVLQEKEHNAISELSNYLYNFSYRLSGELSRTSLGISTLMSGVWTYRMHKAVCEILLPNSDINVLEIGPGSGRLGLNILLSEHYESYSTLEAAQAFYVYQNSLFNDFCRVNLNKSNRLMSSKVRQYCWFDFCRPEYSIGRANVVHAHHNLNEIRINALHYILLRVSQGFGELPGVIISESQVTPKVAEIAKFYGINFGTLVTTDITNAWTPLGERTSATDPSQIGFGCFLGFKNMEPSNDEINQIINSLIGRNKQIDYLHFEKISDLGLPDVYLSSSPGEKWLKLSSADYTSERPAALR